MAASGFSPVPYHAYVPSFGEWGYVLAQAQPGTYRVTGRVGQLQVEGDSFRFTG